MQLWARIDMIGADHSFGTLFIVSGSSTRRFESGEVGAGRAGHAVSPRGHPE
jgi:hypothetical protein